MLKRIIAFSLHHAGLIVVLSVLLMGVTWYTLYHIPVDVFPELNAPTVVIMTESGGLSADEVEHYVSFQIESGINGLPGLRRIRSSSALGLSIVWAEFNWDVDIYRARQMISERLTLIEEELPKDAHTGMAPISSITGEIMLVSLMAENDAVTPMDVRAYAEFDLRNQLLSIPGISQVVAIGGWLPEYQVEVRQEALQLYNISSERVSEALAEAHNINTGGFLGNVEGLELPMRQSGRVKNISDIEQTVVSVHNGTPVTVKDVAHVQFGGAYRRGAASDNGKAAVVLSLQKAPGTNTLRLTHLIDDKLDQLEGAIKNKQLILNRHVFRQADFIERSVNNVTSTLTEAIIFVVIILVLFLMNIRTTLITLTALPLSLGATVLAMWSLDMTINVMTLGGLAVAIGILVDDAIIDVENVYRRLGENAQLPESEQRSALRIIYDASNEIRSSVVFATVIICMVFIPLLFLQGLEGRFFRPLGMTYMISVIASLFVAMTVTPALCWFLLRGHAQAEHKDSALVRYLKQWYRPLLDTCLSFKTLLLSAAAGLIVASLWLASTFGSSFLPEFNEGTYTVFLTMPPGTSLDESERLAFGVEQQLLEIEGIEHVVRRTGRAERDEHAEPPSSSECEVRMSPDADPASILAAIDDVLKDIPGVSPSIGQPISHRLSHVLSGTKAQIAITVFNEDMDTLRTVSQNIESALKQLKGARDVMNPEIRINTLPINFRQQDLARYGLSAADAGRQIRRALFGEHITVINEGIKRFDLMLRLDKQQRDSIDDIKQLVLISDSGTYVRLFEVADIGMDRTSNLILRKNTKRNLIVSCNVAEGENLGDLVAEVKQIVKPIIEGTGCTVEFGGQFEAQQSASKNIILMSGVIVVVMFILLFAALNGARPALLVMVNLPLALIGGIMAMFLAESEAPFSNMLALLNGSSTYVAPVVSIASLVGFITLFGIAVRNGILLVNHFHWLRLHTDLSLDEVIKRGSEERLIPVLMTAMTAALGLIPLALKAGQPGSELLAPLAIVVLGGLISATLLNMLVVPAGYQLFCRKFSGELTQERELLDEPR